MQKQSLLHRLKQKIKSFIRYFKEPEKPVSQFNGPHDCGIRALLKVVPDLPHEKVKEAFMHCCEWWPYGGITNKEFNIALRYLKIFDHFVYDDRDNMCIGEFISDYQNNYILLLHGHFTFIRNGKIQDAPFYTNSKSDEKVYCSWKLQKG